MKSTYHIGVIIWVLIFCTICTIAYRLYSHSDNGVYSYGPNGMTETRCIDGMKFIVGHSGSIQQILGPNGGGVQCQ